MNKILKSAGILLAQNGNCDSPCIVYCEYCPVRQFHNNISENCEINRIDKVKQFLKQFPPEETFEYLL